MLNRGVPKNVTPNIAYDATKQKQQQNSDLPKILIVEDNDELREYLLQYTVGRL